MIEQRFNILIVEDERLVAKDIAERLKQKGYDIAGIADNYNVAFDLFNEHHPDLILLDINIKGDKNGIHIAQQINLTKPTPFIFITAQTDAETLQKAKDTFPSAYLVKPFTTTHLAVSIDLALHNFSYQKNTASTTDLESKEEGNLYTKQDFVFIKDSTCYIKINQNDVYMIESDGNYVKIHTLEKIYLIRCTISKAIKKMNKPYFVRVHRSFCVNLNKITSFSEQEITIENLKVPIGRNYKEDFVRNFDLQ